MRERIRIASGQGFWGDWLEAPVMQATRGPIDYLMMDYLAEVTMSIMQKQKLRNPSLGYARDFPEVVERLLPVMRERPFKIITNAGGVNPEACRDRVMEIARAQGMHSLRVAVVTGDNLLPRIDQLLQEGIRLDNMESGASFEEIRDRLVSANVYFGAWPIVEALQQGADIVITGRTTDTGLTLAPMIYEFGWQETDWDKLAAGTVAGHINECGAQSTGGNFTDWQQVPDLAHIGFPIIEAFPDGSFEVTKHEGTGGLVTEATVKEQLLYEIGDPREYITPDCIADFTTIELAQTGNDRVRVSGVKGRPATAFYKVSAAYAAGWKAASTLVYSWPDAAEKARAAARILKQRLDDLGLTFEEFRVELIGLNALTEDAAPLPCPEREWNEVMLRVAVRGQDKEVVARFGKEIAPLILTGPSGVTGFAGGRPRPSEVIAYWPALIPKTAVHPEVSVEVVGSVAAERSGER